MEFQDLDKIFRHIEKKEYDMLENYSKEKINCVIRIKYNSNFNVIPEKTPSFSFQENRIGQVEWKKKLEYKFNNQCGIRKEKKIYQACHIYDFAKCSEEEKYNLGNGILLTPNLHMVFDKNLFMIDEDTCRVKVLVTPEKHDEYDLKGIDNFYIAELDNDTSKKFLKMRNKNIKLN